MLGSGHPGLETNTLYYWTLYSSVKYTTTNAKEAEVEWFYEDLQDPLELIHKKGYPFISGHWDTKVGSQEIPGTTGKFGLGVQSEAGQRLIECCQKNSLVIANTLL